MGFVLGMVPGYFSFAVVLHLAETGEFHPVALAIPFVPPVLGFLAGWKVQEYLESRN